MSLSEAAKEWISRGIARELKKFRLPCKIEAEYEPDWGYIYYVTMDAREVLDINLRLQEKFKGIPIVFEWTGETDVSEEELSEKLAEILLRGH